MQIMRDPTLQFIISLVVAPLFAILGVSLGGASASLAGWLVLELMQAIVFGTVGGVSILAALGFGLAIAVVGMFGDLAESLMKRDAQIKDSSSWMPGLGGFLDVVDSLLAVSPLAALVWSSELLQLPARATG